MFILPFLVFHTFRFSFSFFTLIFSRFSFLVERLCGENVLPVGFVWPFSFSYLLWNWMFSHGGPRDWTKKHAVGNEVCRAYFSLFLSLLLLALPRLCIFCKGWELSSYISNTRRGIGLRLWGKTGLSFCLIE